MNINDYINEFEQLNKKLVTYKIELPSAVRAYQLLKNANLPKEKRDLARATVPDLTYESMKKQIKTIYDQCLASENKKVESSGDEIQVESEVYYGQGRDQGWISDTGIDGPTFVPKSGYFLPILLKVCPQKLAFS